MFGNPSVQKFFFSSIIYSGRALISSNKMPTYWPNTPTVNNWTPPKKITEVMIEVQPVSALLKPYILPKVNQTASMIPTNTAIKPKLVARRNGFLEK